MTAGSRLKYISIATLDFLPSVCALATSLNKHEPGAELVCYLVGGEINARQAAALPFRVRRADTLPVPDRQNFFFQYSAKELCCALKPYALADALREDDSCAVAYLDADIRIFAPFSALFRTHLDVHAVLVTPHLLSPASAPHILAIMRAGIYNAGVVAVRRDAEGNRFVDWWQGRVARECIRDPFGGVSGDQRWLDLAAGLFPALGVLRDPGINVGFWNLHERQLSRVNGGLRINQQCELRAFHFSQVTAAGFAPFATANMGTGDWAIAWELVQAYHQELVEWVRVCPVAGVYPWNYFADGTPIGPEQREVVRRRLLQVDDPFQERARIAAATPTDPVAAFGHRPSFWVDSGPGLLATANANLAVANANVARLRRHIVIGRVIRLWQRWVNPDI